MLTIGEVAEAVGVSPQTLRVWEAKGLVVPERSSGGQRLYAEDHVQRARQVAELRRRHGWNPAAIRSSLAAPRATEATRPQWNGPLIRRARRDRGLTLKEAAERIGISPSFLSSIERGESGVSTQIIARIADAFLTPMSGLARFRARDTTVVRADERARSVVEGGVTWEELVLPGHDLEPALLTIPPGRGSGGPYTRPGETFAFVLSGKLQFILTDTEEKLEVGVGDAIILPPRTLYEWSNPGRRVARAMWVEHLPADAWEAPATARVVARTRRAAGASGKD